MPLTVRRPNQYADFWSVYGHSYFFHATGTFDQTGRTDNLFRSALDIEANNWRNMAISGAMQIINGRHTGGWVRMFQEVNKQSGKTHPYTPEGGGLVMCYGINDLGVLTPTTQIREAFKNVNRAMISRWRASTVKENTDASCVYTGGFASFAATENSGINVHRTSTTPATVTITLPADYKGEPVSVCFIGTFGLTGGVVTFSGTAGVTGTLTTSDVMPSATGSFCPVIKRITNLTAANAGQTIVASVTSLDAGGAVRFDGWWLESKSPNPILLLNINRLTASGYAFYGGWGGTEASKDAEVQAVNVDIAGVIAEFDGMVQHVDIDSVIAKNTDFATDGIHPNERGAARIVDQMLLALNRMSAIGPDGSPTSCFNSPAPRQGSVVLPRISGRWYTADYKAFGANITAVAQQQFWIPFQITEPRSQWINFSIEATAAVAGTTIRWGIYDDMFYTGYPQCLLDLTETATFTVTNTIGVKASPNFATTWEPDPGLYWLSMKFLTIGAAHTFKTILGPLPYLPNLDATGLSTNAEYSGFTLTGQGTGALSKVAPSTATLLRATPLIGIKKN